MKAISATRALMITMLGIAIASYATASPFQNGSFESPTIATNVELPTGDTSMPGWTTGGPATIAHAVGPNVYNPYGAEDGNEYVVFNGGNQPAGATLSQTFDTIIGQMYAVSYFVGRYGTGAGTLQVRADVQSSSGDLLVRYDVSAPADVGWGAQTNFSFTATTTNTLITFSDISSATLGVDLMLDNVLVVPVATPLAVKYYKVGKGIEFTQFDAGLPVEGGWATGGAYNFGCDVVLSSSGAVTSVTIQTPLGATVPLDPSLDGILFQGADEFSTKVDLDTNYPPGTYTFTIGTVSDGVKIVPVNLSADNYPDAPHVSNWSAAQAVNPATDFTVTWDPFPGGTTNDFVLFQFYGGEVFHTPYPGQPGALNGTATSVVIPAGTLNSSQTYTAQVLISRMSSIDLTSYPGAVGTAEYAKTTAFLLRTTASTYTITASAGLNGTISPAGTITRNAGDSQAFTATPSPCYTVDKWLVDGVGVQTNGSSYTLSNIQSNHNVSVTFKLLTYTITPSSSGGGTVSPLVIVNCGSSATVTASPNTGYNFVNWTESGTQISTIASYTFTASANRTLVANFTLVPPPTCPGVTGSWNSLTQSCKTKSTGQQCKIKGRLLLKNDSDTDAASRMVQYYLSSDQLFDGGDTPLKQVSTGAIKKGKSKQRTLSATLASGVSASGKYVLAVYDCEGKSIAIPYGPLP